jgi:translation initiation factor IF-2
VAQKSDEVDILREEVSRDLRSALSNIKLQERGVYVQASTLGSLEALLEFLRTSKIPVSTLFFFQAVFSVAFPVQLLSCVIIAVVAQI